MRFWQKLRGTSIVGSYFHSRPSNAFLQDKQNAGTGCKLGSTKKSPDSLFFAESLNIRTRVDEVHPNLSARRSMVGRIADSLMYAMLRCHTMVPVLSSYSDDRFITMGRYARCCGMIVSKKHLLQSITMFLGAELMGHVRIAYHVTLAVFEADLHAYISHSSVRICGYFSVRNRVLLARPIY